MPNDTMGMGDQMGAATAPPPEAPAAQDENEPNTLFLSKAMLGGRNVKKGDFLEVEIVEVDPEDGAAEGRITDHDTGEGLADGGGDNEAAFDKAMPAEKGEY